jgi:hypothetical protein
MNLNRRVVKLEVASAVERARLEPVYTEEDLACMQRIIDRTFADPVRYAARIAFFRERGVLPSWGQGSPPVPVP